MERLGSHKCCAFVVFDLTRIANPASVVNMQNLNSDALDRWITGNYGEDAFGNHPEDEPSAEMMGMEGPPPEEETECDQCGQGIDGHELIEFDSGGGRYECTWAENTRLEDRN
jgi:hypothetical protein